MLRTEIWLHYVAREGFAESMQQDLDYKLYIKGIRDMPKIKSEKQKGVRSYFKEDHFLQKTVNSACYL